jgi:predicted MFS family arabinose efflux permease
MYVASLFILIGGTGDGRPPFLIAGGVVALIVCAMSVYLATRGMADRPHHPGFDWALAGVALFYVAIAIGASVAGPEYALAGVAAGVFPLTATALLVAAARSKTATQDGRLRDASADASGDPYPGIGVDEDTALGETPQYSDARRD